MKSLSSLFFTLGLLGVLAACASLPTPQTTASEPAVTASSGEVTATQIVSSTTAVSSTRSIFPLTIIDAAGQEFTFATPPKLGCQWYGCMEILADLGIPAHAAGMEESETTSVFYSPAGPPAHLIKDGANPEEWAAAEVDLILVRVPVDAENDVLKSAAPVFYLHHPSYGESSEHGYQAYIKNLQLIGQLTDHVAAADAALVRFETVLANLKSLSTAETAKQQVAVLFKSDAYSGLNLNNPFCATLAEVGLGQCIDVDQDKSWLEVNAEQFLAIDPDWIVYMVGSGETYKDRTDPVWSQLKAVKAGHVYDAQGDRYYCCSTRGLIHAMQEYVHFVLPDANIPAPAAVAEFDPLQSPLVKP